MEIISARNDIVGFLVSCAAVLFLDFQTSLKWAGGGHVMTFDPALEQTSIVVLEVGLVHSQQIISAIGR